MSSGCCCNIHFDIYRKWRRVYLLRNYIFVKCLRMGEIKIGRNAEKSRMWNVVIRESRKTEEYNAVLILWVEGVVNTATNWCGVFLKHWLTCCGTVHTFSIRLAAHRPRNVLLWARNPLVSFPPDIGFWKECRNKC